MTKTLSRSIAPASVKRTAIIAATLASALCAAPAAYALPVATWSIAGPGTTSVTQIGANSTLSYNLNPAGFGTPSWTGSAIAGAAGNYTFNWDYSGFHAFFNVTAFLNSNSPSGSVTLVNTGPANCCTSPSGGFSYVGTYTFAGLNAGDTFGFTFGGHNFDSNNVLAGSLKLEQVGADVPEPASLALFGLALAGLAASRRRAC